MANICVVSPDIVGPVKNGGIGTHVWHLCHDLVSAGLKVTVLFTGPYTVGNRSYWKNYYASRQITLVDLVDIPKLDYPINNHWFVEQSYRLFRYLREQDFNTIHFQDWHANGFHCIQAKRTLGEFPQTALTVTMHSSTEWQLEGMKRWSQDPIGDAKLQWCERYCCQHCDVLVSPSQHMFDWCSGHDWQLSPHRRLIRYCFTKKEPSAPVISQKNSIAFFGRLETRKGLERFVAALKLLPESSRGALNVYFVGKDGIAAGISGIQFIRNEMPREISYRVLSDLDSEAALSFLAENRPIVVVPSLLDNYPFTVIECCMAGLPLLAARTGGIPEILNDQCLFEPTPKGIAERLADAMADKISFGSYWYDPVKAASDWVKLSNEKIAFEQPTRSENVKRKIAESGPLVSICVSHFNYGSFLSELIKSVQSSTYENFEMIVVDDDSTDDNSIAIFEHLKASTNDNRISYFTKLNGGCAETRNWAASRARGQYLIFMDADNLATPTMIETFLTGMELSGADVMTCHFKAFEHTKVIDSEDDAPLYGYCPIGPALEIGWLENVFGDTNFMVRRQVFEALGGFSNDRDSVWEDWDFLARLALRGYTQEVVPKPIFWYRITPTGRSRTAESYASHRQILKAYGDAGPPHLTHILKSVAVPKFYLSRTNGSRPANNVMSSLTQSRRDYTQPDHTLIVTWLFRIILGREPDPAGLTYYVKRLENGTWPRTVAAHIMKSAEYSAQKWSWWQEACRNAGEPEIPPTMFASKSNYVLKLALKRAVFDN